LFGQVKTKKDSRTEAFIPQTRLAAFVQAPQSLGWIIGQNALDRPPQGDGRIEHAITLFAASSNGGLILTESAAATVHRELIIALAARHRLPAVDYAR
jgi:hypothetical protein